MKVLYNPLAYEHIFNIYDKTEERWGESQAEEYVRGLYKSIELAAKKQKVWKKYLSYNEKLERPVYSISYKKHYIFFETIEEQNIMFVLAIFHEAMDIPNRLKDVISITDKN